VETARGIEYGQVVIAERQVDVEDVVLPLKKVVRIATRNDTDHVDENRQLAQEALQVCQKKVLEHQLDMNIVDAEYNFYCNKAIFNITSVGRLDFRQFVKELDSKFKTNY